VLRINATFELQFFIPVYDECGCVPFFLIRNSSMKVCDIHGMECYFPHEYIFLNDFDHLLVSDGFCKCLPSCNSIEYKVEVIGERHTERYIDDAEYYEADLEFSYRDTEIFPLIRYQEFKIKDFLSFVGGLLGLFAGISVLSIIEFVYFFTLRLAVDLFRRFRRD
jgi:amiloride-sensitive sodium channel